MKSKEIFDKVSSIFPDDLKCIINDTSQEHDKIKLLCNLHHALATKVPDNRKDEQWVSDATRLIGTYFIKLTK